MFSEYLGQNSHSNRNNIVFKRTTWGELLIWRKFSIQAPYRLFNRLQYIFFGSYFWFDSLKTSLKPSNFISFEAVFGSATTLTLNFSFFFFFFFFLRYVKTKEAVWRRDQSVSARSACVVLCPLSYSVRDLISGAGLITQQMGTECSVTKTKTNPQLDYGSVCVCVRPHMCVHVCLCPVRLSSSDLIVKQIPKCVVIRVQQSSSFLPPLPICLLCLSFNTWSSWPLYPACPHKSFKHTFNSVNLELSSMCLCVSVSVKHRRWRNIKKNRIEY